MTRKFTPYTERYGSIPLVTEPVADVNDASRFPEIARAIDHAREIRAMRLAPPGHSDEPASGLAAVAGSVPNAVLPLEFRPDRDGAFDEIVARFADGMVHVETMSGKSCYVGFYWDDGRVCQWWISSKKKLRYHHEDTVSEPPRFTAQGVDRKPWLPDFMAIATEQANKAFLPEGDEDWRAVSAGLDGILTDMEKREAFDELHGCMIRRPGDCCEVRKEFLAVALDALAASAGVTRTGRDSEAGSVGEADSTRSAESGDAPTPPAINKDN